MGKNKKQESYKAAEEQFVAVEEALTKTELFIEKNMKSLIIGFGVIVLLVVAYFSYDRFVAGPREAEAQNAIFMAQKYFEKDSLNIALNGSGDYAGFLDIMDEYSGTKAGNLAKYYTGMIYFKQGELDKAIDIFDDFTVDDHIVSSIDVGAIGDIYMQKGDMDKALDYYKKAIQKNDNDFIGPIYLQKIGWVYELKQDWENVIKTFEQLKKDYPKSIEARSAEKNIARAEAKLGK